MPWAYGLKTTENGKQMIIDYHGKQVPGGIVDWLDNKGKIHHTEAPIYVIGDKKGYPKISIHGVLDDTRKNFVNGLEVARQRLKDFRESKRKMLKNPMKFEEKMDKAVKEYYEKNGLKGLPMKSVRKNAIPYNGVAGKIAKKALNEAINKRAKWLDRRGGMEGYAEARKAHLDKKFAKGRKKSVYPSMIYIDPEDGHMKMGRLAIPKEERTEKLYNTLRRGNNTYLINAPGRKKVAKATHEKSLLNVYPENTVYVAKKTWEEMSKPERAEHARKVLGIKKDAVDPQTKRKYAQSKLINKYNMLPVATKALHLPK